MSTVTLSKTAPQILRDAAALILKNGFGLMRGGTTADRMGLFGINLTTAVMWATYGKDSRPRELTTLQSEHVAEVLDCLEGELRMPIDLYERKYPHALPQHVASDLRLAAWNLENTLGMSS